MRRRIRKYEELRKNLIVYFGNDRMIRYKLKAEGSGLQVGRYWFGSSIVNDCTFHLYVYKNRFMRAKIYYA